MKKLMLVLAVTGAVGCAGLAWAGPQDDDPGRGPGEGRGPEGHPGMAFGRVMHDPEFAKSLGVTDEQIAKLRESSYEMRKQKIKLEAERELAKLEIQQLMEQDKPDREALNKAVEESGRVETELQKLHIQQRLTMDEVLGEETLAKIRDSMRDQVQERSRDRAGRRGERGERRDHGRGEWQKGGQPCGMKAPPTPPPADDDDDDGDDAPPPEGQ
jgi:Spy/CpxP family protein refolding chaperone